MLYNRVKYFRYRGETHRESSHRCYFFPGWCCFSPYDGKIHPSLAECPASHRWPEYAAVTPPCFHRPDPLAVWLPSGGILLQRDTHSRDPVWTSGLPRVSGEHSGGPAAGKPLPGNKALPKKSAMPGGFLPIVPRGMFWISRSGPTSGRLASFLPLFAGPHACIKKTLHTKGGTAARGSWTKS